MIRGVGSMLLAGFEGVFGGGASLSVEGNLVYLVGLL